VIVGVAPACGLVPIAAIAAATMTDAAIARRRALVPVGLLRDTFRVAEKVSNSVSKRA